ncbi:MAG: MnmC family methyltransferase [Candidatus Melainabacteria bacterium]|nr:MnmC family methyltransferase [Candidatus Melainabacteria bacterium]
MDINSPFVRETTLDGSSTYKNLEYNETYHSNIGAYTEALYKHVLACKLDELANSSLAETSVEPAILSFPVIRILDVCFGLAYNSGVAIQKIWEINPAQRIEIIGLENDAAIIAELPNIEVPEDYLFIRDSIMKPLAEQAKKLLVASGRGAVHQDDENVESEVLQPSTIGELNLLTENLNMRILINDARNAVTEIEDDYFDAIFFDPFSPKTCPVLWTEEFIAAVVSKAKPKAYISTYSSARIAKDNFSKAGCELFEGPKLNRRNGGVLARKKESSC